jgi:hypothetical protein
MKFHFPSNAGSHPLSLKSPPYSWSWVVSLSALLHRSSPPPSKPPLSLSPAVPPSLSLSGRICLLRTSLSLSLCGRICLLRSSSRSSPSRRRFTELCLLRQKPPPLSLPLAPMPVVHIPLGGFSLGGRPPSTLHPPSLAFCFQRIWRPDLSLATLKTKVLWLSLSLARFVGWCFHYLIEL